MSTTTETQTSTPRTTQRPTTRQKPRPASTDPAIELLVKRPTSEITRLVFMALLGCAACIALVGVVGEANAPATSPDAPAPAVIVELTD